MMERAGAQRTASSWTSRGGVLGAGIRRVSTSPGVRHGWWEMAVALTQPARETLATLGYPSDTVADRHVSRGQQDSRTRLIVFVSRTGSRKRHWAR